MSKTYKFPCGCSWPVLEDNPPDDVIPLLDFDVELAPEDCPAAWGLLGKGGTKGVFQLESSLGKTWTKKLKPEKAEHIAALGAILRPGCLRAVDEDGVSMTQHYCLRKNGQEAVKSYHPAIDPILFPTYNVLCYQEQAMAIAQAVAGFSLQEADVLRKAIGKKLPEEMAKCKKMFLEGAERAGVIIKEMADEVFSWIEKSQRYSFNSSHAYCYGLTGYECAYIKAHFPVAFFTSWLYNARHKQDPRQEIFELVNDARLFDVDVQPPDFRSLEPNFHSDRRVVKFGLSDIKGIGGTQIAKVTEAVRKAEALLGKPVGEWGWWEFLTRFSSTVTSSVVTRLAEAGALRWMGVPRQIMLAEFKAWEQLTATEQKWVLANADTGSVVSALQALGMPRKATPKKPPRPRVPKDNMAETLAELARLDKEYADLSRDDNRLTMAYEGQLGADIDPEEQWAMAAGSLEIDRLIAANREAHKKLTKLGPAQPPPPEPTGPFGGCSTEARRSLVNSLASLLKSPPTPLVDTPHWLAYVEQELLGISLTCSKIDSCDISQVNCTCKEFLAGRTGFMMFGVEVQGVREFKTKRGKNPGAKMAFLTVSDGTCCLDDVVCFPDVWKEFGPLFTEGNTVIIQGARDQLNKDSNSLTVVKAWQASLPECG